MWILGLWVLLSWPSLGLPFRVTVMNEFVPFIVALCYFLSSDDFFWVSLIIVISLSVLAPDGRSSSWSGIGMASSKLDLRLLCARKVCSYYNLLRLSILSKPSTLIVWILKRSLFRVIKRGRWLRSKFGEWSSSASWIGSNGVPNCISPSTLLVMSSSSKLTSVPSTSYLSFLGLTRVLTFFLLTSGEPFNGDYPETSAVLIL